ncbi:MAG TPA: flagellar motor switch protein FliM [Peptococcaceae bacterium]|nr:MAG: Flagellar motor switch protein FliM [Clostridia bacterium 41_269]HBT20141.1 flagellar motor switch protein FliM [Peptococcaceae bacterium]
MDEVLSQEEIDSLLSALTRGELDTEKFKQQQESPKVVKYDFKRPNKFSKDQLRTLYLIHDNFARMLSNFLSAYLRANIKIEIVSVDQTTYEDLVVSFPSPTLITVCKIKPSEESILMIFSPGFLFPIIDLVFGGPGVMPQITRDLTDIEITVMRKINLKILEHLAYAWEDVVSISPELVSLETNPQFSQLYSPSENCAVVTMTTEVREYESLITLCLPYLALEPIISKLSAQYWFAGSSAAAKDGVTPQLKKTILKAPVELTVFLGKTTITMRDFLKMRKGDVIPLDNKVDEDLEMWVEKKKKFRVQPGIIGQRKGVYIKGLIG